MDPVAFSLLRASRIISVIRGASADQALGSARAVAAGGVALIEITFTVPEALRVMKAFASTPGATPGATMGAGTVLTADQARAALDAGARFIVAPNFSPEVARVTLAAGVMYCPGAYTPTEILAARDAGAHVVKVHPVGVAGGPDYIRVIRDPLPDVPMLAAGGTTLENFVPFLNAGCVGVGLGPAIADPKLAEAGRWDDITQRARVFLQRLAEARASGLPAQAGV